MGYESLQITELLSVKCLQVDDVIPIVTLLKTKTSIKSIHSSKSSATKQIFENHTYQNHNIYTAGDNIGITSSTCRHCTLSNFVMCSDSYPIPILSLFLYHPYIPYFLIQRIFHFLAIFVTVYAEINHMSAKCILCKGLNTALKERFHEN